RFDLQEEGGVMESECRLNLACLAVGSTFKENALALVTLPPQSSLFGCRFDFVVIFTPRRINIPASI
ncbi:hypothetical protein, partial [Victivallis sp.]|uniref:hypothetical protein n=1 Tax=Victivallis sp. TaxID=2049020 RepID=UPI003A90C365